MLQFRICCTSLDNSSKPQAWYIISPQGGILSRERVDARGLMRYSGNALLSHIKISSKTVAFSVGMWYNIRSDPISRGGLRRTTKEKRTWN